MRLRIIISAVFVLLFTCNAYSAEPSNQEITAVFETDIQNLALRAIYGQTVNFTTDFHNVSVDLYNLKKMSDGNISLLNSISTFSKSLEEIYVIFSLRGIMSRYYGTSVTDGELLKTYYEQRIQKQLQSQNQVSEPEV